MPIKPVPPCALWFALGAFIFLLTMAIFGQ